MSRRTFEFQDGKSSKFWEIWQERNAVHTRYGRIGSDGQTTVKDAGSSDKAAKLFEKLISEKTKKGYVEVRPAGKVSRTSPESEFAARIAKIEAAAARAGVSLPKGATPAAISAAEKALGVRLSPEVRAFYLAHDGGGGPANVVCQDRELLSLEGMVSQWQVWKDVMDSGELDDDNAGPDDGVAQKWWSLGWIPLTHDSGGNHHVLDLDPAKGGKSGQIVSMYHDDGARGLEGPDFLTWLEGQTWGGSEDAEPAPEKEKATQTKKVARTPGKPEVIVGTLMDWPLGPRLARLLKLPDEVTRIGCFQVVGKHGSDVSSKVFAVKESIPKSLKPWESVIHSVLETFSVAPSELAVYSAFHANLSAEALKDHLAKHYVVRSPAEALEARRLPPSESLARIEKAVSRVSGLGCNKKHLLEYLAGGKLRESLLDAESNALGEICVASPEAGNEVDARLFHLWAKCAAEDAFPLAPHPRASLPELGFDRFGAYRQMLAATVGEQPMHAYFLRKLPMSSARWWPSTGVWVWEQLAKDANALVTSVLADPVDFPQALEAALAQVLIAAFWVPAAAAEGPALQWLRETCASRALVPDGTFKKLIESDDDSASLLEGIIRTGKSRPVRGMEANSRSGRQLEALGGWLAG